MSKVHVTSFDSAPVKAMNPTTRGTQRLLIQGAIEGVTSVDMIRFAIRTRNQGVYHLHERTDNVMLVLSGVLEMIVDGKRHILRANEMIFIPRGVPHSSASGSDAPVQGIEVYAPARGTDSVPVDVPAVIGDATPATIPG